MQSEATAEHPNMPKAVIRAGAATLVVPLDRIGQVVDELIVGTARPQAQSELDAIRHAFGDVCLV